MSTRPWYDKSMELVRRHNLGFLHNPGGGQFTNSEKGINIQVSAMDDQDDYKTILRGLQKLGLEPEPPNAGGNSAGTALSCQSGVAQRSES